MDISEVREFIDKQSWIFKKTVSLCILGTIRTGISLLTDTSTG